jgi:MOB kinase activator 1
MFPGANKTLRQRDHAKGGKREKLSQFAKKTLATLGSGSMRSAVALPKGEDLKEWIAVNTVDFFNEINLLYGTISEFCTKEKCPVMSAGASVNYLWRDGVKVKKPIEVSAPEYVELLMTWSESQLNDETIFPISFGSEYPKNFMPIVKQIYKRFFRVYAHIYHSHFSRIVRVGAEAHLNTCFKHFIYFVKEFKLIDDKELKPLEDLINKIMGGATKSETKDKSGSSSSSASTSASSSGSSGSAGSSSTSSTSSTTSPTTSIIGH